MNDETYLTVTKERSRVDLNLKWVGSFNIDIICVNR